MIELTSTGSTCYKTVLYNQVIEMENLVIEYERLKNEYQILNMKYESSEGIIRALNTTVETQSSFIDNLKGQSKTYPSTSQNSFHVFTISEDTKVPTSVKDDDSN
ncbi:hypothetical protein PPL_05222 [Heterostelium album PN500]|uniref:Uncharacterized protein n=1 Tax=Heterostelium pallidum (strain ATCC 26659 / Pp 5 / PN500) TaxID=670386 RepID=D3B9S6_HETP5|nr:hypothetical protein PPL_05222 [Heterostelium album PN500]EFA81988.1 hypothetical protein PPL_05222 [Heterostelium album PN500]|eukprot:XP_020434105.1 hypothetical protein PPL_05222 [Heterostelium album PN500]